MQYTINQIFDLIHSTVYEIRDVFNNFFGEEFVDLQLDNGTHSIIYRHLGKDFALSPSTDGDKLYEVSDETITKIKNATAESRAIFYVWWPTVTVTNEYNRSVDIQDLYAKVIVNLNGKIPFECPGFQLNRATYSRIQFQSGYLHSHIRTIPKRAFNEFMNPCLGRGPIGGTIGSLKTDNDITLWMLFCQELGMYVTVESIAGGPWKRMETIGNKQYQWYNNYDLEETSTSAFVSVFGKERLKEFIQYYIQHGHLSINYIDGIFQSGLPYHEYIIDISNAFIDFFNKYYTRHTSTIIENCSTSGLLNTVTMSNGLFYKSTSINYVDLSVYQGSHVLTFKGKDIRINIFDTDTVDTTSNITVIDYRLAMYILSNILKTINFRYKNGYINSLNNSSTASDATADKKVYYI